jgi:hypothetical protein
VATAPSDKLPHSRVDPLVNVMVPPRFVFPEFPKTTAPETVSFGLPEDAKVKVAVPLLVPSEREAHDGVPSTVTVTLTLTTTASMEPPGPSVVR